MKSYTLVELMIVILIVTILVAISIPLLRGHIDAAKWSEGKTIANLIATSIRTWSISTGRTGFFNENTLDVLNLGLRKDDLDGAYFAESNFAWQVSFDGRELLYSIMVSRPGGIYYGPDQRTLDNTGHWDQ